jgi:hypothetical protein
MILPAVAALLVVVVAACGAPPELSRRGSPVPTPSISPAPSTFPPTVVPTVAPTIPPISTPAQPTFDVSTAVPCGGRPEGGQVIAVLKRARLLASSFRGPVSVGPMCAGTWQWSVLDTDNGPLQAVTEIRANTLRLVTAGTDVCSIEVRAGAPTGIRAAACDALPPTI